MFSLKTTNFITQPIRHPKNHPNNKHLVPPAQKFRANMTLSEVLLWQELQKKQLDFRFSRQIPIDRYIVDFYCKDLILAIEIDGESHFHDEAPQRDAERQVRLESFGVRFLRFDDLDVKRDIRWVVNEIYHWIEEHQGEMVI